MLIYKRARACEEFKDGAPPGTVFVLNPESGYINKDIFVQWMRHFIEFVQQLRIGRFFFFLMVIPLTRKTQRRCC
jgi:hypothetical protein